MFIRRWTRNNILRDINIIKTVSKDLNHSITELWKHFYSQDERIRRLKDANKALRHRVHHLEVNEQSLQEAILRVGEGVDLIATHVGMKLEIEPPKEAELVLKKKTRK